MTTKLMGIGVGCLIALVCLGQPIAIAQPVAEESNEDLDAGFREELNRYQFSFLEDSMPLAISDASVMTWTNPVVRDQRGAVFVWFHNRRPQVIGCCFRNGGAGDKSRVQEFHSLAGQPLRAVLDNREVWLPQETMTLSAYPDAPHPAITPQGRAIQMRQLARRFTAQVIRDDGDQTELRLIARPVLTYAPQSDECTDGALFVFAAGGTDPDAFLVLENREVAGKPTWMYGLARFHFNGLAAQLAGTEVWRVEAKPRLADNFLGSKTYRNDIYIVFRTY